MLNITENSVSKDVKTEKYKSFSFLSEHRKHRGMMRVLTIFLIALIIGLLLPWTQNIRAKGKVTTLRPDQRPQTIHSIIAGRIEKWFVREGDFVNKGDTILFISEIKDEYFDPQLLDRTGDQLKSKEMSVDAYMEKVKAIDVRIDALVRTSELKIQQAKNYLKQARLKVQSDSVKLEASGTNLEIARKQFERTEALYKDGLKSKTELENKRMSLQKAEAERIEAENNLLSGRNSVINAEVELTSISAKFQDEIAKAESEKYSALSSMYDTEIAVTKLQNQYMNYSVRNGMYYITAPQDGYVTKAMQSGIGETIKDGDPIVSIMPADYQLAVELYVRPIDLPLVQKGQKVRIQFDGWPAIVFSGWPNTSYGTYGGITFAIDNFISDNGMYRILVAPDPNDHPWPSALRVGAGTNNMMLLKDVQVYYELWRQINGFPPDYYVAETSDKKEKKP
ncbi:MAG: HlyD family efflux transporter periplasmic adaptor subunit [Bacteroidetes bacterium]|nr:HlyD family efflux transporter periplasmic adaptor subunit [Bacteroidota bacterium]